MRILKSWLSIDMLKPMKDNPWMAGKIRNIETISVDFLMGQDSKTRMPCDTQRIQHGNKEFKI